MPRPLTAAALAVAAAAAGGGAAAPPYAPTWDSLNARPLPSWYDDAKIGIFIHWGVYSVPSFAPPGSGQPAEWFWHNLADNMTAYLDFVGGTEAPGFAYADYAPRFNAYFFNATAWAALFKAAGARYVVPTAKHHDGFCLWPSATAFNWNSMDVGPRRDLIGELAGAVKAAGLTFGVYHSAWEGRVGAGGEGAVWWGGALGGGMGCAWAGGALCGSIAAARHGARGGVTPCRAPYSRPQH